MSIKFHPQSDGHFESTIQVLKDMLRSYVLVFGGPWDLSLPLVKFANNNSYNISIQMVPFVELYGR